MIEEHTIPQEPPQNSPPRIAMGMAYIFKPPPPSTVRNYRLERGFPYPRAGTVVQSIPQFKGLTIYARTSASARGGLFNTTGSPINVAVPVRT